MWEISALAREMIVINQLASNGILWILGNLSSVTYYGEVRGITFGKGRPVSIHACQTSSWTFSASPDTGEHTKCTAHCWAFILIIHPKWTLPHIIHLCQSKEEHPPQSSFQYSDLIFWPCIHFNEAAKSVWAWFPILWNELNSRFTELQKSLHAKSSSSL